MYETMQVWETMVTDEGSPSYDYAQIWRSVDKIVFSESLKAANTSKTRISRSFESDEIAALKRESVRDVGIGGPHLAAAAFRSGLIDECRLFACPVLVGSGNRALPNNIFLKLDLVDQRRFRSGVVYLRYRIA
jgi:dihydrofolate reductase